MSIRLTKQFSDSGNDIHEIDVTPIMNVLIIMFPFLLSLVVFTKLSILSFSLPPNVGSGLDQRSGMPKLKITVVVATDYYAITHGDQVLDSIPMANGDQSVSVLQEKLKMRRNEVEIRDEAVIAVRDAVKFQNMVRVMDACRSAGFEKIGVSSATTDAAKGV